MDAQVISDKCGQVIRDAGIVIFDGNLSVDVMTKVMSLCVEGNVPGEQILFKTSLNYKANFFTFISLTQFSPGG
jgi:hypothetical protein